MFARPRREADVPHRVGDLVVRMLSDLQAGVPRYVVAVGVTEAVKADVRPAARLRGSPALMAACRLSARTGRG